MTYQFDYLLAGGGCAGLAMACQLRHRFGPEVRILIVDRDEKTENDRSWAFWSSQALPLGLDQIVKHQWSEVSFRAPSWERSSSIQPYTYKLINGLDYYAFLQRKLERSANTFFLRAEISQVGEDKQGPWAEIAGDRYWAQWIFDSRIPKQDISATSQSTYFLWQHFRGWRIQTDRPVFDVQSATLMDFSMNTSGDSSFFYCLPFSPTEALVEYTAFSPTTWEREVYERQLGTYIRQRFGPLHYRIVEEEAGRIPMTNMDFVDRRFRRIRSIGTAANAVKSTTGYAFLRIQEQVKQMVEGLANRGDVDHATTVKDRWHWYDQLLLYLLQHHPTRSRDIFVALFKRQPYDRILRFLDEESRWWEDVLIFKDLPISWFAEAAWKHQLNLQAPWPISTALNNDPQYG